MIVGTGNYGEYSTENYGSSRYVRIDDLTLYFSYDTVVAFECRGYPLTVSENLWGPTTGKHLNWIESDKKRRLPREDFERILKEVLNLDKAALINEMLIDDVITKKEAERMKKALVIKAL